MPRSITVLIFDWRYIVAKGIEAFVKENFDQLMVHSVTNDQEFVTFIKTLKPKIIFIQENKIVKFYNLLSQLEDTFFIVIGKQKFHNLNLNIAFYLPLGSSEDYFYQNFTRYVLSLIFDHYDFNEQEPDLSQREKQVVRLIAMGYTNQQIAQHLNISPHTVITHRKNITRKLGIKTISGLTIYAILNNLVSLDELENKGIK